MKLNRKIKKLLVVTAWLLVGSGMTTLLVAANNKPEVHSCQQVVISIQGEGGKFYIDKNDIYGQIKYATGGVVGRPIAEVDLTELERMLEGQTWIRDAELYFDSRNVLHVLVAERDPIARVFTTSGRSFYMDSTGMRMPLLPSVSARLPVVSGFTDARKLYKGDSAVLRDITRLAQFINSHPFWQAQIAQIDITPAGTYELMPVIGNHIIRIGSADDVEEKLDRLFLFYKQVLKQAGFDKYGIVDVQFKDQVIGIKSKVTSAVDSIQLQKNIEELIQRTKLQAAADSMAVQQAKEAALQKDTAVVKMPATEKLESTTTKKETQTSNKVQVKSNVVEKPKSTQNKQQPKAIMPKSKGAV